jgi:4'-phosphopantetheinyl transferase EntD
MRIECRNGFASASCAPTDDAPPTQPPMTAPLLATVLPAGSELAADEVYTDPPGLTPFPQEEPLIARAVAKRRNEFITVRHCARVALAQLGVPAAPILKGDKGEPCWPAGVVGSLTHCAGYRGAVVGRAEYFRSVGIDAEPHDVLPHGVFDAVSLPAERRQLAGQPPTLHWDRILFCAKEATYKAWYPLTHRWLGFEDAHITFDLHADAQSGAFTSEILIDPAALAGPPLTLLSGRWSVRAGLVFTAIVL